MDGTRTETQDTDDRAAALPQSYPQLRELLQARLTQLAAGQQRIARMILDDPEGVALNTIGQAAARAGVHQSSLVRFAAKLGFSGYPPLVRLCRDQLASEAQLVRRMERADSAAGERPLFADIVDHDTRNLNRTFAQISSNKWQAAVAAIAAAPHVYVIGMRKCFSVAYLTAYLLHMVRPDVRLLATDAGLLFDDLRDMQPGDVLIAASIRRYTRDTVRVTEYARSLGVITIALTDAASSPLARSSEHVFYVETGSVTILRSLSAFTSLVQALATSVAVHGGTTTRQELLIDEDLLERFEVYLEPELPLPPAVNTHRRPPASQSG